MSDKRTQEKLKSIPGEKIRRQYFNVAIYPLLLFVLLVLTMCMITWFGNGTRDEKIEDMASLMVALLCLAVPLLPLIVLSILNRFYFGRVICVLNEKGLYFADGFVDEDVFFKADGNVRMIKWEHIRKVAYEPDGFHFSAHGSGCRNCAYITTKPYKKEIVAEVNHAPFMLLRKMKKYCPNAKYGFTGFGWFLVALYALLPTVMAILAIFME